MSDLIVVTFDDEDQARDLLRTLRGLQQQGFVHLNDTAVVTKDANGKVHTKNEASGSTEIGAVAGGVLGLLLGFMFPMVGAVVGAAGGAAVGALLDRGVDGTFVKQMSDELKPNASALFALFDRLDPMAIQALEPYTGRLYQTTLPSDLEERLKTALE